jgi:hypothetical protein
MKFNLKLENRMSGSRAAKTNNEESSKGGYLSCMSSACPPPLANRC